jgi:anti-sigma-K factor RskA
VEQIHTALQRLQSGLATSPDAVEVTLEPASGSQTPTGTVILAWSIS